MANKKKQPSDLLGEILRAMLEDTGVCTSRTEWAKRLHVDPSMVSKWINQHVLIQPRQLLNILDVVERDGDKFEPIQAFWKAARLSPDEIAPARGLPCSIGEWVSRAEKERLMEQLEGEDGRVQLMICRLAADFRLLASRAELDLGSEERAIGLVEEIGDVMGKLITRNDLATVRDLVVVEPTSRKRRGSESGSKVPRPKVRTMTDQEVAARHHLVRGANVVPIILPATKPAGANVISMRRSPEESDAVTNLQSIPGFSWRWAKIEPSLSLADVVNCSEAFIFVCHGTVEIKSSASDRGSQILGPQSICRMSEQPSLEAVTLFALSGTSALVFLLFAIGGAEDEKTLASNLVCEHIDLSDEERLIQQSYIHQPATGAHSHARAYKRKQIARSPIKTISSKRSQRRIHCDIIRASHLEETSELKRDAGFHPGHEVIIPIVGAMTMYFGEPTQKNSDPFDLLQNFKNPTQLLLRSIDADPWAVPDVLVFDSNVAHGFAATNGKFAYAIHLRLCAPSDETNNMPVPRVAEVHTFPAKGASSEGAST